MKTAAESGFFSYAHNHATSGDLVQDIQHLEHPGHELSGASVQKMEGDRGGPETVDLGEGDSDQ